MSVEALVSVFCACAAVVLIAIAAWIATAIGRSLIHLFTSKTGEWS